ncbi:hypothetical protein J2Y60_003467 [Arcicella sp. BE140]|nr:hypothetical protein [Arcicella sp. BE51]MDR6813256.1 hypothetical protein [Arcicella sp. BE140]MDR6824570.1 hypothetical protein [Arcicella sp. BE139]
MQKIKILLAYLLVFCANKYANAVFGDNLY